MYLRESSICIPYSDNGGYVEGAQVFYTVGGSMCDLSLRRTVCNDGNVNSLSFVLHDSVLCSVRKAIRFWIFKEGSDLLNVIDPEVCSNAWTKTRKNVDARGGVTDTKVCLYGTAKQVWSSCFGVQKGLS
ncbi:hypothetical protein V8G54_011162 [Vigna mungo]|uniref:Uncharacterized protein n=1 Tax=Vigna mungo TaxID=3915 RepID=A0AAQ3NRH2_VIGMU